MSEVPRPYVSSFPGLPIGSCLLGLFAGILLSALLCHSGIEKGDLIFQSFAPLAVVLSALGALWGNDQKPFKLLWRAWLTSFSLWVPAPLSTWTLLLWRSRYEVFDLHNFPLAVVIVFIFALLGTIAGWVLALTMMVLKKILFRS